ncbi:MAG: hypothetical protein RPS47_11365 [Colwellia sp.]
MQVVDAVKTKEEIKLMASLLEKHHGAIYSHMWIFGVNAALRISDLLSVTMEHALTGTISLKEGKTDKLRTIPLNQTAMVMWSSNPVQLNRSLS